MSNVGRMLYGYCNGEFGRDSYHERRIEAEGYDWVVARDDDGDPAMATFKNAAQKEIMLDKWSVSPIDED